METGKDGSNRYIPVSGRDLNADANLHVARRTRRSRSKWTDSGVSSSTKLSKLIADDGTG
jgi:hypothetical protein